MENRPPHDPSVHLEDILQNLDQQVRNSLELLEDWTEQGRRLFRDRPEVVAAGVALGGFATGLLARQGERKRFRVDPLLLFFGGALAGFFVGPRVMDKVTGFSGPRAIEPESRH